VVNPTVKSIGMSARELDGIEPGNITRPVMLPFSEPVKAISFVVGSNEAADEPFQEEGLPKPDIAVIAMIQYRRIEIRPGDAI